MIFAKILYILEWAANIITIADMLSWYFQGQSLGSLLNNPDKPLIGSIAELLAGVDVPSVVLWSMSVSLIVLASFGIYRYHAKKEVQGVARYD